jgi:hypothetical protein
MLLKPCPTIIAIPHDGKILWLVESRRHGEQGFTMTLELIISAAPVMYNGS